MELRLQPKPEVEIPPASQGIVSREQFFVKKKFEEINQYFFPAHFIRNWKPKAELIYPTVSDETGIEYECDFNRDVQSCFVEDNAEEVFLRAPPPCFVVVGKCGARVRRLGRELAEEFGSVLIQVEEIIAGVLRTQTETGKVLDRLLRLGVALTLNFVLALLSYAAHTAEARHRGYVLCGLPCIPEDCDLPAEQQLNYLWTWDNKPTVFIHVVFDDEDLIKERTGLRYEIGQAGAETCMCAHGESGEEEEGSEGEEEGCEGCEGCQGGSGGKWGEGGDLGVSPSRPWVQLPRDEESQVWIELELFDNKIRPAVELLISRVDPQYLITVDSRLENNLEVVLARLSLLQIWKVPTAVPFIPPRRRSVVAERSGSEENMTNDGDEVEEEQSVGEGDIDPEIRRAAKEPPQTAFLTLFAKNTISPKFRWELSHYNYICPVSLREGEVVEGKSEFAVVFMKYIYFLRSEEAMLKFMQNPRAYVLPIRPEPLTRFIVVGYPYSGKTTLATGLSMLFSIPLIDANAILKSDLDRKKSIYQEFCRQKAECRETIRLSAQAWEEWRVEEERRISLIEEWIAYVQTLLTQRIEQFYSAAESEGASGKEVELREHSPGGEIGGEGSEGSVRSGESRRRASGDGPLAVCGVAISVGGANAAQGSPSPSDKIIKAMKHEDFDFNEPYLEVEANLFFSTLWNTFSGTEEQRNSSEDLLKYEELGEDGEGMMGQEAEEGEESYTVDWCSLLPPQSLSSFLMSRMPYTTREKRQSFKIFLEAASKAYWTPCKLKSEFAKWRLPCFMNIPLCEIFLDNPILLLRYIPEWLKERPLIPDPVDPTHPSIAEAGQAAFERAGVVTIKQNKEEVAVLLRDAVEKAEREGMRVSGEVISPGGWVLDNLGLDLEVWKRLACEGVFADHIYVLMDTEPEHRRIINAWCKMNRSFLESWWTESENQDEEEEEEEEEEEGEVKEKRDSEEAVRKVDSKRLSGLKAKPPETTEENCIAVLTEIVKMNAQDDYQLDDVYDRLLDDLDACKGYVPPVSVDVFSHHVFQNNVETWNELKEETMNEEALLAIQTLSHYSTVSFFTKQTSFPFQNTPLGPQLQRFTSALMNTFAKRPPPTRENLPESQSLSECLDFFISLLTLPKKIQDLKDWMASLDRGASVTEVEVTGRTPHAVLFDIRKQLMKHFIKKPRELEEFEVEEIKKSERREKRWGGGAESWEEEEPEEEEEEGGEEEEDVRVFGESGPLCIVNLERDIFLMGKREFAVRYYGKLYYFWDAKAKERFLGNPEKYAPYYSVIRCYPPLRIYVVGPLGSGKTTLAKVISRQMSLPYVNYGEFIIRRLVPHLNLTYEKFTSLGDPKLLLSEDYNAAAKAIKEKFMNAPYNIRKFWLENPVYEDHLDMKAKLKKKLIDLKKPLLPSSFPELSYQCVEAVGGRADEGRPRLPSAAADAPYVSMKALKSVVQSYFENAAELSDYCVEKTAKVLWTTEPYLSHGIILEGFPLRFFDVKHLVEHNWLPDVVFEMRLSEEVVVERSIDALMDAWDTQLKHEMIEEKALEDTLTSVRRLCMRHRRNELLAERRAGAGGGEEVEAERVSMRDSVLSSGMEEYLGEVDDILKGEFPELSFNPVFETYESGKSRITNNLLRSYRRDMTELEKIKAVLKEVGVSWHEVDNLRDVKENAVESFLLLDKVRRRENFRGEFAFAMSMEMAEKLLAQGYYFLSKFGRWCPVQVYRMKNPIHMFRPLSAKGKVTPIAYRNYIYFVGGENEKLKFIQDPVRYTFNEPHHPNIPLRVAVIGPPKSGKSTLCTRLGRTFDLKVVTMGSALRFVLEEMPKSTLARSISGYLRRGCFLPLSFKVEALVTCLNDPACVTQGFVFDGVPFDAALMQSLAERGKLPFVIISLVADADLGRTNRQGLDLSQFRLPYKNRVNLNSRYADWNDTYKRFAQWNQHTYNNLYEVSAKLNVVDIFYRAYDIIRKSFFGILYYVEYCVTSRALPLHYLCVGQHEYELRKSPFHNNCPVCWVEDNRLSNSSDPPPRSGLVQHLHHFYWICPPHMDKFLKRPKAYLPPLAPPPPLLLPKTITKPDFDLIAPPPKVHGFGRCPVTRIDFPQALDWEGSWDHAAFYADEVYLCKTRDMLDRFLARPWRYHKADTEFEAHRPAKSSAVEQLGPPKVTSLPPIGFLEQTVADAIHQGLQVLGSVRPVYPSKHPAVTGCTFLALYLKAHNKNNRTPTLEKEYLDFMINNCKAYKFRVPHLKRPEAEAGQGDFDSYWGSHRNSDDSSEDNENSQSTQSSGSLGGLGEQCCWLDLEAQADKKMWSAKVQRTDGATMRITSDDELQEIPEVQMVHVVLKYQTYTLRSNPLPPVSNCLTFLYSVTPPLRIRDNFNYNALYQPPSPLSSPYPAALMFNPEKAFDASLYMERQPEAPSEENLWKGKRAYSSDSIAPQKQQPDVDPDLKLMMERFVPRFQLLDKLTSVKVPPVPEPVEEDLIIFNPHRDYAYTLLLSEFFLTTHVLRCYEWEEGCRHLEYSNVLDRSLALCNVQVDFFLSPHVAPSFASWRSFQSYRGAFDAATAFAVGPQAQPPSPSAENLHPDAKDKSSLVNFAQLIILEKLDELFNRVSLSSLSYDSYEVNLVLTDSDTNGKQPSILIREILPYPPLPWDILSRPYYAYTSAPYIFQPPTLDNIAHERHFSVLDGIIEPNDHMKFVRYPNSVQLKQEKQQPVADPRAGRRHKPFDPSKRVYVFYDFFNLPWTSFLTYPFSWACNLDVKGHFCEFHDTDSPLCAQELEPTAT